MKIDILNADKLIRVNNIEPVTSALLLKNRNYNPDGILSERIFGYSVLDRKERFGYIDLKFHYFHPQVYQETISKGFRLMTSVVNGTKYVKINDKGNLIEDPNGNTGIKWLYDNWSKLTNYFKRSNYGKVLSVLDRDEVFVQKIIVIPAFYREIILSNKTSSTIKVDELNQIYSNLIRSVDYISNNVIALNSDSAYASVQKTLVNLYLYFKGKLEKKYGIIRYHLMSKRVDYGIRTVISGESFEGNVSNKTWKYDTGYIPLAQACVAAFPFVLKYIQNFFDNIKISYEIPSKYYKKDEPYGSLEIYEPDVQFDNEFCTRLIDNFIHNSGSRYEKIYIKIINERNEKRDIPLTITNFDGSSLEMHIVELIYQAAFDACENKYAYITRYPITDIYGLFFVKCEVLSTVKDKQVNINNTTYPHYPIIPDNYNTIAHSEIGRDFIDTLKFSNSRLKAIGGDFDGDQVSLRILFTVEANEQARIINKNKVDKLSLNGGSMRPIENEVLQSLFLLTQNPDDKSKEVDNFDDIKQMTSNYFTKTDIVNLLGHTSTIDIINNKKIITDRKPKYNYRDIIKVNKGDLQCIDKSFTTTIGRFLFNKFVIDGSSLGNNISYMDGILTEDGLKSVDTLVADLYLKSIITPDQIDDYYTNRDAFGLMLIGIILPSLSYNSMILPTSIKKLKKELMDKYQQEILNGDIDIMVKIEKELTTAVKEELAKDESFPLFNSGAKPNIKNNYKVNYICKGPVLNTETNKYEFVASDLATGITQEDIAIYAQSIVSSYYPSAVGTRESGYQSKEILTMMQTERTDEHGTDCGSQKYITYKVDKNIAAEYRYAKIGSKLVLITPDNYKEYEGQILQFRSPMYCTSEKVCNMCAGEYMYMMGISNYGFLSSRISGVLLNLKLKKKHDTSVSNSSISTFL